MTKTFNTNAPIPHAASSLYNLDRTHPKSVWVNAFIYFLSLLKITTKDNPEPAPIVPFDSQLMFLSQLCDGLEAGCHFFVNLKARQLGISTVLLALDIFWLYMNPKMVGMFIADTDENLQIFRATIVEMLESLPDEYKIPIARHNRYELCLKNGSRLQYMRGGGKKNDKLGRSRGVSFVHATELCRFEDPKAIDSLMDALSTENPNRLYMFESTARGSGLWQDMYENARDDGLSQRAFFIGWWSKRLYSYNSDTPQFKRWWGDDPELNAYEAIVNQIVKMTYGYDITPEQWAWYRERQSGRSVESMREEMPSVAEEAFQYSGQNFFNQRAVAADKTAIKALNASFHGYTYAFGLNLIDMKIEKATSADDIMLRVWEMPVRGAQYVMGIDPSYCSSEESDAAVIQVYRCFADKLVQVAEFASNEVQPNHLAWVMCHLCGEYGGKNGTILLNLEINGPGNDVYRNMRDLKLQLALQTIKAPDDNDDWLLNALTKTRWYIYTRDDNISASGGGSYNSKTTRTLKVVWYNCYRDMYSTEQLIIRSLPLLDEMRTLRQDGDEIRASGRNHDDLCMGTALAVDAYWQHIRRGMIANNRTYASEMASQVDNKIVPPEPTIYNTLVPNFMNQRRREIHQAAFENLKNSIVGDW